MMIHNTTWQIFHQTSSLLNRSLEEMVEEEDEMEEEEMEEDKMEEEEDEMALLRDEAREERGMGGIGLRGSSWGDIWW